jgi:D-alanyl-D-alanine carboxypeptidase
MTKVMTAYAVLKKIKNGHMSLSTLLTVGPQPPLLEGTKMFLHKGEAISIEDLLKGLLDNDKYIQQKINNQRYYQIITTQKNTK